MKIETDCKPTASNRLAGGVLLLLALAASLALGCGQADSKNQATYGAATRSADGSGNAAAGPAAESSQTTGPATTLKPRELVDRMIKAYRGATSYADAGQVRIKLQRANQQPQDIKPFIQSVSFVRPNQIRVECFDSVLVCDGKRLRGSASNVPQQVLEIDAPDKLRLSDLLAGEALRESLEQGPAGFPFQLLLLFPDAILPPVIETGEPKLLAGDAFDGHDCQRVQFDTPEGPLVLWIDPQSYVLRLMELPVGNIRKQLEAEGPVKHLSLTVEFLGAAERSGAASGL